MSFHKIKLADAVDGVATITLFNPERRNAIGPQMVNELLHALARLASDAAVRVVVLTGEGKAFCAGGDFQQMSGGAPSEGGASQGRGQHEHGARGQPRQDAPADTGGGRWRQTSNGLYV